MPLIGLTLSLLFSAFLIVRDCRRRRSVSAAVWIPTILVMVLGSRPVSLWLSGRSAHLGIEMANDSAGSSVDQLFFLSVLGSSLIIASLRGMKWKKLFASNPGLMFFYAYFAISILWSSDPLGSTKRLTKDFGLLFVIGLIFTEKNPFQAMRAVYLRSAMLLLPLSVVFIKWFPDYGRAYGIAGEVMLTGVTTQKNSLGEIVLLFTLFLVWEYFETRPAGAKFNLRKTPWDLLLLLMMGAWLLHLSQSKTALVCTMAAVALICRSGKLLSKGTSNAALAGAISLPILVFCSQQFSEVFTPILHALGRDMTFTGRTDIWSHITLQTVNPLIGAGYWNFWGGPGGYKVNLEMHGVIPNAHNGYVDLFLDGGLIGLMVLAIMLIACGRRIIRHISPGRDLTHYHRARLAMMAALIIYNISESTFARMGPIWFSSLLMIVEFPILQPAAASAGRAVRRAVRKPVRQPWQQPLVPR